MSEFLVSLGLFFLIMTADLIILNSAGASSTQAANTQEALNLAREGIEELIVSSKLGKPIHRQQSFSSKRTTGSAAISFQRTVRVAPLDGALKGLSQAVVTVDWNNGERQVRLERYVAGL